MELKDKYLETMKADIKGFIDNLDKLNGILRKVTDKYKNGLDCQIAVGLEVLLGSLTMCYCFSKDRILNKI